MPSNHFTWKDKEIRTHGDMMRALQDLESREEAREFMKVYSAHNVHAYQNVGYAAGYFDRETAQRIYEWCETSHPIFGRSEPTPEEAFEMGQRFAEEGMS